MVSLQLTHLCRFRTSYECYRLCVVIFAEIIKTKLIFEPCNLIYMILINVSFRWIWLIKMWINLTCFFIIQWRRRVFVKYTPSFRLTYCHGFNEFFAVSLLLTGYPWHSPVKIKVNRRVLQGYCSPPLLCNPCLSVCLASRVKNLHLVIKYARYRHYNRV